MTNNNPRQLAVIVLRDIERREAYTDIALDRVLCQTKIKDADRRLLTELVYGIVRRKRTLDALIDQLGNKKSQQQPPDLRIILQIGLYQLRYLNQIPASAAVNTSVELAKTIGLKKLAGVVNGILRQYIRLAEEKGDPLELPENPVQRLGICQSFPDWMIELWLRELGREATEKLSEWFNQPPTIDLRINPLQTTLETVEFALSEIGANISRLPFLPQALRLTGGIGSIQQLPGFAQGWWTVQDASAQLVSHLLAPQPGETIIDACAAPGGKTTHIAEIMGDKGQIWACDRDPKRLQQLTKNAQRLHLQSIQICTGDSRSFSQFSQKANRVLLDAPCSGLGTLQRHPDIRWRQTPEKAQELSGLQRELLEQTANWVKPGGVLVYSTCTLNSLENERVIDFFLATHPDWHIELPSPNSPASAFVLSSGWIKILPHQHQMDGFFMVKLRKK
jgi:16S rRNA (cytosine967-C5)-methyltransferase